MSMLGPFLEIRVTDVIDIAVVAALVYTVIAWVRRTQAAQVATGILILGGVYLVARALELQLIAWIFQGFFAIFVIIIVVIFQEELRQLFERVAVWSFRRRGQATPAFHPTDLLVEVLSDFARDRIGALVVIPGSQPINRHLRGGIELNGAVSLPLLKSIFDSHSPGHDGAVILEDSRVLRFAVHLPLSKNVQKLRGGGTRHSAALGLAELSDALCLVVSEERGRVSIAHEGELRQLRNPQELGQVLQDFFEARRPTPEARTGIIQFLRGNLIEKAVSVALVIGLWYALVPGGRLTQFSYDIPIRLINLPAGYTLEEITPVQVQVTLSGARRAFYLLDARRLEVVIDASLANLGRRTFQISAPDVRHAEGFSLERVSPPSVKISVRKAPDQAARGAKGES